MKLNFDYSKLIGSLDDDAFRFCIDELYDVVFSFHYTDKEEVRPCDAMEQMELIKRKLDKSIDEYGDAGYFTHILTQYFDNLPQMNPPTSRTNLYLDKAKEILGKTRKTYGDYYDVVMIYAVLNSEINNGKKTYSESIDFIVKKEDVTRLKETVFSKEKEPSGLVKKDFLFGEFSYEKNYAKKFFFAYAVFLLAHCLQAQCDF